MHSRKRIIAAGRYPNTREYRQLCERYPEARPLPINFERDVCVRCGRRDEGFGFEGRCDDGAAHVLVPDGDALALTRRVDESRFYLPPDYIEGVINGREGDVAHARTAP